MRSWGLTLLVAAVAVCAACTGHAATSLPQAHPIGAGPGTDPRAECLALVEQPWTTSRSAVDPIGALSRGLLSGLPGGSSAHVVDVKEYGTPESYVDTNSGILHPDARIDAMRRDGFTAGIVASYSSNQGEYDVTVLQFTGNNEAIDYSKVHLRDACERVLHAERLPGGEGIVYTRTDDSTRTVFVVGDAEVSLCGCFHASDPSAVAADAAGSIFRQLTDTSA